MKRETLTDKSGEVRQMTRLDIKKFRPAVEGYRLPCWTYYQVANAGKDIADFPVFKIAERQRAD